VTVPGLVTGEVVTGISHIPEHDAFLLLITSATWQPVRIAIVTRGGRLLGTSAVPAASTSGRSVTNLQVGLLCAHQRGFVSGSNGVYRFNPSLVLERAGLALTYVQAQRECPRRGTGRRSWLGLTVSTSVQLYAYTLTASNTLEFSGSQSQFLYSLFPGGGSRIRGMSVIGRRLFVLASGGGLGIGTFPSPTSLPTSLTYRSAGLAAAEAYTGVVYRTAGTEVLATAGADGTADLRVPAAERATRGASP